MSKARSFEGFDGIQDRREETSTRAKRASEVHPPHVAAALVKRGRGRPAGSLTSNKIQVTLRLDREAVDRLKAQGPGWHSRINDAVRKAAGL